MSRRAKLVCAIAIFLISYATRLLQGVDLATVMYTPEQPFGGLTETYDQRAVSILEGDGVLGPYDINPSRTVWLAQAPGYSIFLSFVYRLVGRDFFRVQAVQNALNSLSPVLIFLIAGFLVSWRVGAVAGLLAALSHHLSHISNYMLPDSLAALPLLTAMLIVIVALRRRYGAWRVWVAAGVMMGMAAWLRPQTMLIGPFALLMLTVLYASRRAVIKRAALAATVAALTISPITIRNYIVYGAFVPINIGLGIVLWEGIGEASGDRFGAVRLDEEVAAQEALLYNNPRYAGTWSSPDGIGRDRDRVKKSLAIIARHPFWYAGVMLGRMREMLKYSAHAPLVFKVREQRERTRTAPIKRSWESLAAASSGPVLGEGLSWLRPVIRALQRIAKEVMLPFILIGAALLLAAARRRALLLLTVPLYYLLFQSFTHTEFRYTLPMHYFLFVFAAIAWLSLADVLRSGLSVVARWRLQRATT
jgi:hypothetical protein